MEQEIVRMFKEWGLLADRIPLSGATSFAKHDVSVTIPRTRAIYRLEVKAGQQVPKRLPQWLGDADMLILRGDREEPLFVVPLKIMRELMT